MKEKEKEIKERNMVNKKKMEYDRSLGWWEWARQPTW